jgi:hypothetical protein
MCDSIQSFSATLIYIFESIYREGGDCTPLCSVGNTGETLLNRCVESTQSFVALNRLKYDVHDKYRRENQVLKEKLHQPPMRFVHEQNIIFLTGKHNDHHGTLVI